MKLTTVKTKNLKKAKRFSLVVSCLIKKNGKILLVKRKNKKRFPGFWGLPNGKVKLGEKLEDAVKREVKEETGLKIKVLKPYLMTQEFHDDHHHLVIAFKGKILGGKLKAGSDAEEVRWISRKEIKNLKIQPTAKLQIRVS